MDFKDKIHVIIIIILMCILTHIISIITVNTYIHEGAAKAGIGRYNPITAKFEWIKHECVKENK